MLALKAMQQEGPGLPDLLNYGSLVADGVVLGKDGSLLAGWFYEGADLDSLPDTSLDKASDLMNAALSTLGGGYSIWVDASRLPSPRYFADGSSRFPDPVSAMIEEERRQHFLHSGRHYETEYALLISYMPPVRSKGRVLDIIYSGGDGEDPSPAAAILADFERVLANLEDLLFGVLKVRRMREFDTYDTAGQPQRRSHILNYLQFCLTGELSSLNIPRHAFYLDTVLGGQDCVPGDTPMIGDKYVAVLTLMGFPAASYAGILSVLDVLPIPLRFSSRWIALDVPEAKKQIGSIERKWRQKVRGFLSIVMEKIGSSQPRIDQDALKMQLEAEGASGRTSSGKFGTGYYTPVVVTMGKTPAEATENARAISREIIRLGFATRIETINAMEAWLGSLPGHTVPNVRRPLIHTDNLADLLPLTSVWTGRPTNPCPFYPPGSPALLQAATTGAAPFYLNLHVGDVAHTLIFGPTGAGKSTLLETIIMQAQRYPGMAIWAFDKGRSAFVATKAMRGDHYDIGDTDGLSFCPLSVLDTEADVAWADEWIATLYELQHGEAPLPQTRDKIHSAMLIHRSRVGKSLTDYASQVQDAKVKEALAPYLVEGPGGRMLDATEDGLREGRVITFEIEDLMGMGERQLIPVLLYLFRRFEKSLKGQPAMLVLDEAWVMLGHPVFREKIREWLKVLRKANCAVILATQSLSDAARSGILDVLVESCPTKIFLPNDQASVDPGGHYKAFGLNEPQIAMIAMATPKRHYYVVSPQGCRLIDLQLGPVALSFVGASSKEDIARVGELSRTYGDEWPGVWLRERGIRV